MKQGTVTKLPQLDKCPTGITGLDEIINGGVPKGRTTLSQGARTAGTGKSTVAGHLAEVIRRVLDKETTSPR